MILTPEKQEAIIQAAMSEIEGVFGKKVESAPLGLINRAMGLATIKHTINALHQPEKTKVKAA